MSNEQAVVEARRKVAELLKDYPEVMKASELAKALRLKRLAVYEKLKKNPDLGFRVGHTVRLFKSKIIEAAETFETKPRQGQGKGVGNG